MSKEVDMIAKELIALNEQLTSIKEQIEETKKEFEEKLDGNIKTYNNFGLKVIRVEQTEREIFDTKKFKNDFEGLYTKYTKKSVVKGGLRYKFEK